MNTFENNLAQVAVFLFGSLGLIFVSRRSLLHIHAHGFYRFFAWEILLGMLILNAETWFRHPFAWYQIISWALLITSLVLVILGLRLLRQIGEPDRGRKEASLLALEKTSKLVTVGLYRYIRHPLYSSLLFLAWGIFFKSPSWLEAALALACTFFLTATARTEERENIAYFGDEYVNYMKRTSRFIPFVF
jgi:protein-S-isoprenylcysteine O-methyltransferase Ste14